MSRGVVLEVARIEAAHLASLVTQFAELLDESDDPTDDPAVRRLVPDAYDDPTDAQEFRDLVAADLLDRRRADAAVVLGSLEGTADVPDDPQHPAFIESVAVALDRVQAAAWLRTLSAVRLVLATRLGIADEDDHDPEDARFGIYDWLGYRLDGLVQAIDDADDPS